MMLSGSALLTKTKLIEVLPDLQTSAGGQLARSEPIMVLQHVGIIKGTADPCYSGEHEVYKLC